MSKQTKMLTMEDYLQLEIERLKQMGWEFPDPMVKLLKSRAKGLDKMAMAEQTRRAYGGGKS